MRLKRIILTIAGGALIAVGFAVPSQAGLTTFCDGVASDVTVPGDLVVRAGDSCELTNVTITGNATVRADANLLLTDANVQGALRVNDNGFASVVESQVNGATRLTEAFGAYSEASTHDLNVVADNSEFYYSLDTGHARNVTATNAEIFLESSQVGSNVTTEGGLLTDLYDSVVEGSVSVTGTELGSVICFSEVDGNVTLSGNAGLVQIGAQAPVEDCGFNVFGSSLTLTGNAADDIVVSDNVIRGDLVCSDNDPAPVISGNRVRGEVQCDAAEAAALRSMGSSAAGAEARTTKSEVLDDIESRTEAGEEAAEDAGAAFE